MRHEPPRLAKRILRWFVNAEFIEEVEGDLDELFHERVERNSVFSAKFLYLWDALRAVRPYQVKRYKTEVGHEIFNWIFLRLAYRNLIKRKAYSAINILGLSIGLVSFLLIMEYVAFERSYDSFHVKADRIYRVAFNWGEIDYQGENSSIYASSVPAIGPAILNEMSEVESFTLFVPVRTVRSYCIVSRYEGNQVAYTGNDERGFYADSAFLKIFSFPVIKGNLSALDKPNSIALTRTFARKIFHDKSLDSIVGETIEVDADNKRSHIVTAILEDVPANSHIQFDYLISYSTINSDRLEDNLVWSQFYTYVLANKVLLDDLMVPVFKKLLDKLYGEESHISIFLQPLESIYLTSRLREELGENGSAAQLTFLTIIAQIILLMAWINYVNMFLARSMERVNEIGVKKVLGSTRAHLTFQFFTESFVITCTSFILGILLLLIVQQSFENWLGKEVSLIIREQNVLVMVVISGVWLGSIAAGLYPAFILASHRPAQVLGSKFNYSNDSIFFKRGLVYFQFIVSFVIVCSTLIIDRQIGFMKNAQLGMELGGRVAIRSPGDRDSTYVERLKSYKERLLNYSFIHDVSFTSSIPGRPIATSGGVQRVLGPELHGNNIFSLQVDENFLNTYEIRLISGRNFSENTADIPTVILNEAALTTLKFESPEEALNHRIHWQRKEYEVIGVFANYNHLFLKEALEPIMLSFNPAPTGFITLKVQNGYHEQAIAKSKEEMQRLFPANPFEYSWLEMTYDYQYHAIQQFELLSRFFAILAILIACLGLFALSYYSVQRRIKEMAVRKVFGAGVLDVFILLSKSYVQIALVSGLVGTCVTFYIMDGWLQNFAFAISLGFQDFVVPVAGIICIVLISVTYNCLRTSFVDPSHTLKQS